MKVLVLGAGGQLGRELLHTAPAGVSVVGAARADCDLSIGADVGTFLERVAPDVVVNAAAYTAVDKAEGDEHAAFAVNAEAPGILATHAAARGTRLVHVSTDYVFDGRAELPYTTTSRAAPAGAYGRTKAEGERRVLELGGEGVAIVRTSWLYSRHEPNFVLTMLRLMRTRGTVAVVADQTGAPTWARTLARAIWNGTMTGTLRGVAHWTDAGITSWYGFASEIARVGAELELLPHDVTVQPIRTADYPTAAVRPAYSVLDISTARDLFGVAPTPWTIALRAMMEELTAA